MADNILLNGKIHSWDDVEIRIMGLELDKGIFAINWKASKEKELQYAGGVQPHGVGYGHRSATCDFTLTKHGADLFETVARAAGKDALDYAPFLITVQYMDKKADGDGLMQQEASVHTVSIMGVDINDREEGADEGTKKIEVKYTAVAAKIVQT